MMSTAHHLSNFTERVVTAMKKIRWYAVPLIVISFIVSLLAVVPQHAYAKEEDSGETKAEANCGIDDTSVRVNYSGENADSLQVKLYPLVSYSTDETDKTEALDYDNLSFDLEYPSEVNNEVFRILQELLPDTDFVNTEDEPVGSDEAFFIIMDAFLRNYASYEAELHYPFMNKDTADKIQQELPKLLAKDSIFLQGGDENAINTKVNTKVSVPWGLYLVVVPEHPELGGFTFSTALPCGATAIHIDGAPNNVPVPGGGTVTIPSDDSKPSVTVTKQLKTSDHSYTRGSEVGFVLSAEVPDLTSIPADRSIGANSRKFIVKDIFEPLDDKGSMPFVDPEVDSVTIQYCSDNDLSKFQPLDRGYKVVATATGLQIDFSELINNSDIKCANLEIEVSARLSKDARTVDSTYTPADLTERGCDPNGNCNNVSVEYSTDPDGSTTEEHGKSVNVYSYKFALKKKAKDQPDSALKNAQFAIINSDNKAMAQIDGLWTTLDAVPTAKPLSDDAVFDASERAGKGIFVSDSDGNIDFSGLKAGTYTVREIAAPSFYYQKALPEFSIAVKESVDDNGRLTSVAYDLTSDSELVTMNNDKTAVIVNNVHNDITIITMPETGGVGIVPLLFWGALCCTAAALAGYSAYKKYNVYKKHSA